MYLITGSVFLASLLLFFSVYLLLFSSKMEIKKRAIEVTGSQKTTIREKELSESIVKRVLKPLLNKFIRVASRLLPSEKEALLNKKIATAGRPGGHGPKEFMAIKLITAVSGTGILILIKPLLSWEPTQWLLIVAAAALAGWTIPDFYLRQKIRARKSEVEKTLPDILDLITVSVEAGMGFDGALFKVVEKGRGVLPLEFLVVLQECKMGKSRKDAMRDMADRLDVDDFSSFVGSIIMAEQLGIGISNVMRLQSDQMRRKRRQRAEESAMKAPVKMMIPMVTCIFPTIFVVLLGPAAISLYQAFMI
ncbi:MAG: type II secretion system F family protein [Desulfocucumaceae bacterium]